MRIPSLYVSDEQRSRWAAAASPGDGSPPWSVLLALLIAGVAPVPTWAQDAAYSLRPVERVRDPLSGRADIGGRVYENRSADGVAPEDSPGIGGVVVVLDDGRHAVTSADGWWQLSEIAPGQRAVTLREDTLPLGALAPRARHIGEAPPGAYVRVDFPVEIQTESPAVGQIEILGHRAFPRLKSIPASVVGNVTDIQALVNGARVRFPRAEVEIVGLARGGFVRPDAFRRVAFTLRQEFDLPPSEWRVTVVDAEGRSRREFKGEGRPPRRLNFDGLDGDGEPLAGPASYSARLCVDYDKDSGVCSPYRTFGVVAMEGRREVQPTLEVPRTEGLARINDEPAPLDEDDSFIVPVRLEEQREISLWLSRDDGRHARTAIEVPELSILGPKEDFGVKWGESTDIYTAPEEPGTIRVRVHGTADPAGSRLRLGTEPIPVEEGEWSIEVDVPLGPSRFELTLTDPQGFNVLDELHFHLGDRCPEGEPLVVQPRIPDLRVELPAEDLVAWRNDIRVRGRAAADARVKINAEPVETTEDGDFDAVVLLDPEKPEVEIVAVDDAGREGSISRSWTSRAAALASGAWIDAGPFVRLIHAGAKEDHDSLRLGLAGALGLHTQRLSWQGTSLYGGAFGGPDDRPAGDVGSFARAGAYAGAETWLGDRLKAGLRYEGAAFLRESGDEGLPDGGGTLAMRHDARLTGALLGEAFDVLLDAGIDTGIPHIDEAGLLAGGGLGLRYRAGRDLDIRVRAGALFALRDGDDDVAEILDASAQITYRPPRQGSPTATLRYSHIEDGRGVHPEAAGDVLQMALAWPVHDGVRFLQVAGVWLAGGGGLTLLNVTRVEFDLMEDTLVAADYRLLTQLDSHGHTATVEGAHQLTPWLRLGGSYQLYNNNDAGETSSRLQARVQALF